MTKDEKYYKLMEIFADKTLSFGCKFIMKNIHNKSGLECRVNDEDSYASIGNSDGGTHELRHLDKDYGCSDKCRIYKIIGHPVRPHHILQRLNKFNFISNISNDGYITILWVLLNTNTQKRMQIKRDLSKDLSGQSEETLDHLLILTEKVND